ncbi:hypothetical protein DO65_4937 [Burkholderia pseudomallei]|nr:hypothetical protein DO65_4937 [Burkholderia pseudomallei]
MDVGARRKETTETETPRLRPRRNVQSARHRRPRDERVERARHVRIAIEFDELARLVEADQVAHPRERRDVGDRIGVVHDPPAMREAAVKHAEQALRLADVALARAFVLVLAARELVEEAELAEHRPDAAHLEHQPLDRLVAARGIGRDEPARLLGEIQQDRARFEQRERLAARAVRIDDRRNLVVRVQRQELGRHLIVRVEAHDVRLVRQLRFLEQDRYLDAVRRRQRIELDALRMLRGPFLRDRKFGKIGHG